MQRTPWSCVLLAVAAALACTAIAQRGTVTEVVVHSAGLEANLLGDSPDRAVSVYLPPDYDMDTSRRYPVVYALHGHDESNRTWVEGFGVAKAADAVIADGTIQPLIIVMPDASNAYGGSYYVNSTVSGNWEDFITKDLVAFIDSHYRTIPQPQSRAIAGDSVGGYGALYIATRHPELYRVVYAASPAPSVGFAGSHAIMEEWASFILRAAESIAGDPKPMSGFDILAMAVAFSPNPNRPPAYVDFPYERRDGEPTKIDAVWDRWVAHTPLAMLEKDAGNLQQYSGIAFDIGTGDADTFVIDARAYSDALTRARIPHRFELYEGGHNVVAPRLQPVILPYLGTHLRGSAASSAEPR